MPQVTIIVPVYNVDEYIGRCIDSILGQTYHDFELLLIDDGSTDRSGYICDQYERRDNRIKVIHQKNGGVSSARNAGLDAAQGDWITFIDADDYVLENYLADLYNETQNRRCDMVVSGYVRSKDGSMEQCPYTDDYVSRPDFLRLFRVHNFKRGYVWGKLYNARIIRRYSLRFNPLVRWAEDALFIYDVLLYCNNIRIIPSVNYVYVFRNGSGAFTMNTYEREFAGYRCISEICKKMEDMFHGGEIYQYVNPYIFMYRTVQAMHKDGVERADRIDRMKLFEFDRHKIYHKTSHWKEAVLKWLLVHRMWHLLDFCMAFIMDKNHNGKLFA